MKLRSDSKMVYDPRGFWRIEVPRSNKKIMPTSLYMLRGHRANCDFTPIFYKEPMLPAIQEYRKTVGYAVNYASKCTDTLKSTTDKMKTMVKNEEDNNTGKDDVKRVAIKCMNQMGKNKLMSKQEAVVQLGNLPLFECSEKIEIISVNEGKIIDAEGNISKSNQMQQYSNRREEFHHLSFYQWQIEKRKKKNCSKEFIPHIVGPSTKPVFPLNERYAKSALKIHFPWKGKFESYFPENPNYIEILEKWIETDKCPKILKNEIIRTEEAAKSPQKNVYDPCTGSDVPDVDPNDPYIDERTRDAVNGLANLQINFNAEDMKCTLDYGINHNWLKRNELLPTHMTMNEIGEYIEDKVKQASRNEKESNDNKLELPKFSDGTNYTASKLTPDQLQVYCNAMITIRSWLKEKERKRLLESEKHSKDNMIVEEEKNQLIMTIAGVGGSGKSVVVKTLVSDVRKIFNSNDTAKVCAPTGAAAFSGGGCTCHREFQLPVRASSDEISSKKLQALKEKFLKTMLLIIDERSMISAENLALMDSYARKSVHLGTNENMMMGGIPIVLLVGDDYQLPPVMALGAASSMDPCPSLPTNPFKRLMVKKGLQLFKEAAQKSYKLRGSQRVMENQSLLNDCLRQVRGDTASGLTKKNIDSMMKYHLSSRHFSANQVKKLTQDVETMHLFANNDAKNDHNRRMLEELNSPENPVAVINAVQVNLCGSKMKEHYDDARCPKKTILCVGCKVYLSGMNIKPEWGLYHGSIGTVLDFIYKSKMGPHETDEGIGKLPLFVLVNFPQYSGPSMYENDPTLTDEEKETKKTYVAIPMMSGRCGNGGMCSRTYMPLNLAFGRTIHSFQGASVGPTPPGRPRNTFQRIICDPGKRGFEAKNPGLFYTLLSRATTFGDPNDLMTSSVYFMGKNMNESRVTRIVFKRDSTLYKGIENSRKWVKELDNNHVPKLNQEEIDDILDWVKHKIKNPVTESELMKYIKL